MAEPRPHDLFDRLFALPPLRPLAPFFARHREVLLYLFFGVLTTAVSWSSFYLGYYCFAWQELIANGFSWVLSVLFAYVTNRCCVFGAEDAPLWRSMGQFFLARLSTLALEEGLLWLLVTHLAYEAMWVKIGGNVLVLLLNYVLSKLWVFRRDTRPGKKP